jgi:hypothetical protein
VYKKDQYYITSNNGDYKDRVTSELHGYHFDQCRPPSTASSTPQAWCTRWYLA